MIGFEPRSSGIGSDRSANCATTTARKVYFLHVLQLLQWRIMGPYLL